MLAVYWIGAFFLFFPIVAVEGVILRQLTGHPWKTSLVASFGANLASTVAGLPLVWGLFFLLQALSPWGGADGVGNLVQTAAWLPPMTNAEYEQRLPAAALVLWGPFFLVSVAIEAYTARFIVNTVARRAWAWSWLGNSVTYGAVALYFLWALYHPAPHR